ncbi:MAG: zonular occludens toxin domain-containing protein [Desulfobacter sp.]
MIAFFVGTPGSGKSYEAVQKIVDNLRLGRVVCTNIDGMEVEAHQRYLQEITGLSDYQFKNQFIFLTPENVVKFWESYTVTDDLDGTPVETVRYICPKGALIIIDEAHKHFNSRDWQNVQNRKLADWASTHRHDGYDVIFITQDIEKVDKQVRTLTEWTYFYRKVNFLGGAVQKKYLCYSYSGDDHRGTPIAKNVRTYNPRIFGAYKSYSTADAKEVGFMQHVNILKHPVFFAIPLVLAFCVYMFSKSSFASGDLFGSKERLASIDKNKAAVVAPASPAAPSDLGPLVQAPISSARLPIIAEPQPDPEPKWRTYPVTGYIKSGSSAVYLVHGLVLQSGQCRNYDPVLKTVSCYGSEIMPRPSSAAFHPGQKEDKEEIAQPTKYEPMGRLTLHRSMHLSDEKEVVNVN